MVTSNPQSVLKTGVSVRASWVRIPPSPLVDLSNAGSGCRITTSGFFFVLPRPRGAHLVRNLSAGGNCGRLQKAVAAASVRRGSASGGCRSSSTTARGGCRIARTATAERHAADCAALDLVRDENRRNNGAHRWAGCQHCFRSLLVCDNSEHFLNAYSNRGKYFRCTYEMTGVCKHQSGFRHDIAKRLILGEIGRRLTADTRFMMDMFMSGFSSVPT
jgi:hypothetical protein